MRPRHTETMTQCVHNTTQPGSVWTFIPALRSQKTNMNRDASLRTVQQQSVLSLSQQVKEASEKWCNRVGEAVSQTKCMRAPES